MKQDERLSALKLDNFNYEHFLRKARMEESNSLAWLDNYKPNDDYEFPPKEQAPTDSESMDTGSIDEYKLPTPLLQTLLTRKSDRINKLTTRWTAKELYKLLELGVGLRGDNRWLIKEPTRQVQFRTYPSGGSMYPVKIFVAVNKVDDLKPAFYQFYPNSHKLVRISKELSTYEYEELFPMSKYKLDADNSESSNSAFSIFFVTNFSYSFPKYGNLAYRLGLIESGHMAQNLSLVGTGMHKKSLPVCGLFADTIAQYANLTRDDFVQYGIIFG
ncbi:SagB/ThcOx family dehydrogenase [Lactiplantibacillus argentoratensis]|uniref:SagB/ThcOx family dehydrogenase n=1 Tax=Lactiplantibacillus TaxID=2767842 RepID=UPI003EBFCF9E